MESFADTSMKDVGELCAPPQTLEDKAEFILDLVNGKGRARILLFLRRNGATRFNDLHRSLGGISPSLLSGHLSVFVDNEIVLRKQYVSVPPKVTYSLTPKGYKISDFIVCTGDIFDGLR